VYKGGHKISWKEVCTLNWTPPIRNTRSPPTFLVAHPISQPSLDNSPIWISIIQAEVKKLHVHPFVKVVFLCWYYIKFASLVLDSVLVVTWFYGSWSLSTTIGTRPYVCEVFFNVCLNSRLRCVWFIYTYIDKWTFSCIPYTVLQILLKFNVGGFY
jgi:hypothetical protein